MPVKFRFVTPNNSLSWFVRWKDRNSCFYTAFLSKPDHQEPFGMWDTDTTHRRRENHAWNNHLRTKFSPRDHSNLLSSSLLSPCPPLGPCTGPPWRSWGTRSCFVRLSHPWRPGYGPAASRWRHCRSGSRCPRLRLYPWSCSSFLPTRGVKQSGDDSSSVFFPTHFANTVFPSNPLYQQSSSQACAPAKRVQMKVCLTKWFHAGVSGGQLSSIRVNSDPNAKAHAW